MLEMNRHMASGGAGLSTLTSSRQPISRHRQMSMAVKSIQKWRNKSIHLSTTKFQT